MAFSLKMLEPIGAVSAGGLVGTSPGNNSMTTWGYGTNQDSIAGVTADGFFNVVRDMVSPGDAIFIWATSFGFRVTFFDTVPRSPSTADVTMSSLGNTPAIP